VGLATGAPLYVLGIDAAANRVTVGPRSALEAPGLVTEPANWLMPAPPAAGTRAQVQIRYRHARAAARLDPCTDGRVTVTFDSPQSAVTPGQACVFYDGERVRGGAGGERAAAAGARAVSAGDAAFARA
jgi:tRNA-specific 2-thiouridylase